MKSLVSVVLQRKIMRVLNAKPLGQIVLNKISLLINVVKFLGLDE